MTSNETTLNHAGNFGLLRNASLVLAGTVIIAIAAQIKVPMWPVPITMQTLAVLLIGLTYGGRLATATLVLYLFEGAVGLPVFASGGGLAQFMGPTGGYLVGFLFAASLLGFASDKGFTKNITGLLGSLTLATALIYLPGVLWLSTFTGVEKALMLGMIPFLLGDVIKAVIVALIARPVRKVLHK
jgi:biotin transport system substrate-specific component